ncbi:hypothetical protein CEXT_214261 [Caerostris extrusa]|uniref:Uncharacterized protein n=1 Tax=Caerostris extrusa TaxID=172846 RepID=A0AAV4N5Q0_CAEEX|nr:hypothetical protein CEXT_214261 [Caerostris extrusa]
MRTRNHDCVFSRKRKKRQSRKKMARIFRDWNLKKSFTQEEEKNVRTKMLLKENSALRHLLEGKFLEFLSLFFPEEEKSSSKDLKLKSLVRKYVLAMILS